MRGVSRWITHAQSRFAITRGCVIASLGDSLWAVSRPVSSILTEIQGSRFDECVVLFVNQEYCRLGIHVIGRSRTDAVGESPRASESIENSADLSLDDIYHLLQTQRRRDVLRYLRTAGDRVRLRELAEQVAAWEQETTVDNLTSDERQRVYISLYQSHLPKLDNHGIVDYDKDRGWVEPTPRAERLHSYLESPSQTSSPDRWPRRYAGTVVCCGLGMAAVTAGIVPITGLVGAWVVLVAFAIVTSAHAWSTGTFDRDQSN